ncbi:MAG: Rieske 2Fe-2S domain-containing protein [Chloroflexia bacterium]
MAKRIAKAIIDKQQWLDDLSDVVQPVINKAFSSGGEAGHVVKDFLNGVWLGHPLHPVITDVPIGAGTVTQLLDIVSAARGGDDGLDRASDIALGAGILGAVGSAVTGITDWSEIGGSQRRMGLAHGLINTVALVLNLTSLMLRTGGDKNSRGLARSLSTVGYLTTAVSAYVGGEMVYNLGTAVSRNAWREGPQKYTDVGAVEDLEEGKMVKFDLENDPVVLVQDEHGIHAFGGVCSHVGCGLWEGKLEGHVVTCQCHGSQFDITDGSVLHGPATDPVPAYQVRKYGGRIQVRMEQT